MAKKVVSVGLRKKTMHPIKQTNKRRKLKIVLKNVFKYLKSDTYMFASLIDPQSYPASSPAYSSVDVSWEPIEKKERKLVEDVREYLICDSYMYAPIVKDSATLNLGRKAAETGSACHEMGQRKEETTGGEVNSSIGDDDRHNPTSRIVVKHNLLQQETVKRIVHQKCRVSSVPGEVLLQKEKRKIVVE